MVKGKVKWFSDERGYGFIESTNGESYFVHWSNIVGDGFKKVSQGQRVCFDTEVNGKGTQAVNVFAWDDTQNAL